MKYPSPGTMYKSSSPVPSTLARHLASLQTRWVLSSDIHLSHLSHRLHTIPRRCRPPRVYLPSSEECIATIMDFSGTWLQNAYHHIDQSHRPLSQSCRQRSITTDSCLQFPSFSSSQNPQTRARYECSARLVAHSAPLFKLLLTPCSPCLLRPIIVQACHQH